MDKATEKAFLQNLVNTIKNKTIPHLEKCRDEVTETVYVCYNPKLKTYLSSRSEYGAWPNPRMATRYLTEFDADAARSYICMDEGNPQPWSLVDAINHQIKQEWKEIEKWEKELAELE